MTTEQTESIGYVTLTYYTCTCPWVSKHCDENHKERVTVPKSLLEAYRESDTTAEPDYQWGVVFEGRDLGWIAFESEDEARGEVFAVDDKYAPARLARRRLGPIEFI